LILSPQLEMSPYYKPQEYLFGGIRETAGLLDEQYHDVLI